VIDWQARGIPLGVPMPNAERHEGWAYYGTFPPSGERDDLLGRTIEALHREYGFGNVATGGTLPRGPGVGVWIKSASLTYQDRWDRWEKLLRWVSEKAQGMRLDGPA
jgi:hypothetical protein